jgi:glycosyltransferase involved in cell wall biosynthesis
MKSVLVDIYKTHHMNTGLGVFSQGFAENMALANVDHDITLLAPRNYRQPKVEKFSYKKENLQMRLFSAMNNQYDLWHSLQQLPSHKPARSIPWLITVHDLNFLIEKSPAKAAKYLGRLQRNINRASAIVVDTDFTGNLLKKHVNLLGTPVKTIYLGVDIQDCEVLTEPFPFYKGEPFFFCLGVVAEKKNFHVVVEMMRFFKEYQLIIAGPNDTSYSNRIKRLIEENNLQKRVHLTGPVSGTQKSWLYENCKAFFFPSLAEGFGIPVIEAMSFGKPVFLSKETCLPEIGSSFAYYFDSFSPDIMASITKSGLIDFYETSVKSEKVKAHAHSFSWQKCIENYLKVYKQILDGESVV